MGLVTDVEWTCPRCGTKNIAQLYDWLYDNYYECEVDDHNCKPLPYKALPANASLKWNPPCEGCGEFKLEEPQGLVEFPIVPVRPEE